ncbi:hypothetical protein NP493_315g04053 [Ridgeia piscesae]|uniref:Uncharacterized protein n=1 Tax=Ridgeia piscesae TaxID=27915 RepID=A0AAD9L5E1_RIDPI|nr:hypothetical protein NP493_315g04053 [Ridgeia piscesae]
MFVGSVNESLLELVEVNGIYLKQDYSHDERPVFRHEQYDIYMYYFVVSNNEEPKGFWVIGPDTSGTDLHLRVSSDAELPELITGQWEVKPVESSWAPLKWFKAACIKETFVACSSGRIVIGGLNPRNKKYLNRLGSYELTETTYQLRPVYRHTERDDTYLYFYNGMWLIGSEVGQGAGYMFVVDNAFRPEFIIHSWVVPFVRQFTIDSGVRVVCEGQESPNNRPSCTGDNECSGRGRCIPTGAKLYLCDCQPGYHGQDCDEEISCGPLPEVTNGRAGPSTGQSLFDVSLYKCREGYLPSQTLAAVCQLDGHWSDRTPCKPNYFRVTPMAP